MEANREAAKTCFKKSLHWEKQERYVKAIKFAKKAYQLFPNEKYKQRVHFIKQKYNEELRIRNNNSNSNNILLTIKSYIINLLPQSIKNLKVVNNYKLIIKILIVINILLLVYRFLYLRHPIGYKTYKTYKYNNDSQLLGNIFPLLLIPFGVFSFGSGSGLSQVLPLLLLLFLFGRRRL